MANNLHTPQPNYAALNSAAPTSTPVAAVIPPLAAEFTTTQWTWPTQMGSVYIKNSGTAGIWVQFKGCPPDATIAPLGVVAKPVYIDAGEAMNLDDILFTDIAMILDVAGSARVQAVAVQRPGDNGEGV